MRYMIACMLKGEPAWKVRHLGDELADVFDLEPVSAQSAPRLTLKAQFETTSERNIEELKIILKKFSQGRLPAPITYDGFGQFDKRVVFVHVRPSPAASALATDLMKTLKQLPWMKFSRTDGEKRFHATMAYVEKRSQFEEVKKYLTGETVQLEGAIDNVSILFQEGNHLNPWKLLAEYTLVTPSVTLSSEQEL